MTRTKYCLLIVTNDFRGKLCGKQRVKTSAVAYEQTENMGMFTSKLVLFGLSKNRDCWWVDRSVCYLPNSL